MNKKNEVKNRKYLLNSPISSYNEYSQYIYALDQGIDNSNVFNVGISAPYGSGKSSLIKSFFDYYPKRKKKMVSISLASFTTVDKKNIDEVEKSILEQILFKRTYCPFSRSRIDRLHFAQPLTLIISALIIATLFLVLCSVLEYFDLLPFSNGTNFNWFVGFTVPSLFVTLFLVLYKTKINKIAFKNIEIEFGRKKSGSILNAFIDEVINFCKESKSAYFVFEDIDRFSSTDLFLKLREINRLINENNSIKHKVTFIYCVKDDIFENSANKSKFFDYSISLVPIYNPNLGLTTFREAITNDNIDNDLNNEETISEELDIDDSALIELTSFVKEIRVLKTIINDYFLYKDELKIKKEDNDKLLAMMIYKNLYSKDFILLQQNNGLIFKTFNEYKSLSADNACKDVLSEIERLKNEKEHAVDEKDLLSEFQHLRDRISGIIATKGEWSSRIPTGFNNNIDIKSYQNIKGLFIPFNISAPYYGAISGFKYLDLNKLQTFLDGKTPFELECDLKEKNRRHYDSLINQASLELSKFKTYSVRELIEKGCFKTEALDEIKKNGFLYFSIINGYIDETYFKFSGREDTAVDNLFIDKVLRNEFVSPDYIIQNPSSLILRLSKNRFATSAVFNYSLLDGILSQKNLKGDAREKLKNFIDMLCNRKEDTIEFLSGFFNYGKERKALLNQLISNDYFNIVEDLSDKLGFDDNGLLKLISEIIDLYSNNKLDVEKLNKNNEIKNACEKTNHLIEAVLINFSNEQIVSFLKTINVTAIKNIDVLLNIKNDRMNEIYNLLFENNFLDINTNNLKIASKVYFKEESVSYGMLIHSKNTETKLRYESNVEKTLSSLIEIGAKIHEDESVISSILSNSDLNNTIKINYLLLLSNKIHFIDGLSEEVYKTLLTNNLLYPEWKALETINARTAIDFGLVAKYAKNNIYDFRDKILDSVFATKIINCDDFTIEDVGLICNNLDCQIDSLLINNDYKRALLIKNKISPLDRDVFLKFKNFTHSIYESVERDSTLIEQLPNIFDSSTDYENLIKSDCISETNVVLVTQFCIKKALVPLTDDVLMIAKNAILKSDGIKLDSGFLPLLIISVHDESIRRNMISDLAHLLSDEDIVLIVKSCDKLLFSALTVAKEKATLYIDTTKKNFYYLLMKNRGLVSESNIRVKKCNIRTKRLKETLKNIK